MKFSRHASPFRQSLIETNADDARNLVHPQPVDGPPNKETGDDAKEPEPVGLVPGRCDAEVQGCAGVVPDAIAVTSDHAKPIVSRRQVCVGNLPSAFRAAPVIIVALELEAELDVFWGSQAESRVFKL